MYIYIYIYIYSYIYKHNIYNSYIYTHVYIFYKLHFKHIITYNKLDLNAQVEYIYCACDMYLKLVLSASTSRK